MTVVRSRVLCALFAACLSAGPATAQTYTWTRNTDGDWSDPANWVGGVPVSGPSTTLAFTNSAPLTAAYTSTNNLPVIPFVLDRLDLNLRFGANITGVGLYGLNIVGNGLRLDANGGTLPTINMAGAAVSVGTPLELAANTTLGGAGNGMLLFENTISGAGSLTLNRSALAGQTVLTTPNAFTGGVVLNSGILAVRAPAGSNASQPSFSTALGTSRLTVNGGTFRFDNFPGTSIGGGIQNPITANSTLAFSGNNSGTLAGVIDGAGGVTNAAAVGINLRLTAANTFTGRLAAVPGPSLSGNSLFLQDGGSALATAGVDVGPLGTLNLDNSGTNLANRLADATTVNLLRGTFTLTGSAAAATAETIGGFSASGSSTVGVGIGGTQSAALTLGSANPLGRSDAAVYFFRGTNLGQNAPGSASTASVLVTDATAQANLTGALVGGGQSPAGTTNTQISVLPFAVGSAAATGNPLTLVTYTPANGVQALLASQFAGAITDGATAPNNVRLTAGTTNLTLGAQVNSLVLAGGGTGGTGTLTVTSGAVLASTAGTAGNLAFPGEGVVTNFVALTVNSITGTSAGLVKNGTGTLTVSTPLAVPGPLTLQAGNLPVATFTNGVLGTTTGVTLNGGRLTFTGGSEATTRGFSLGAAGGGFEVTGGPLTLAGVLADLPNQRGVLNKTGAGTLLLTGANTYTGNTIIGAGTLAVSADANLGDVQTRGDIFLAPGATLSATGSFGTDRQLIVGAGSGNRTVNVPANNTFTLTGPLNPVQAGSGQSFPLTKTGPGVFVLASPANALNGLLIVGGGEVRVTGVLAPLNTDNGVVAGDNVGVAVNATAVLGGTGTVNRLVSAANGGAVSPCLGYGAATAGTLTVEAAAFAGGSQLLIDLRSVAARPGAAPSDVNTNDRLAVRGGLSFATNTTNLTLRLDGTGQSFVVGSTYDYYVASAATVAGFDPGQVSIVPDNFAVDGTFTSQLVGTDLVVTFVPVPEPGLLLVPAAVAWLALRRRLSVNA